MSTKTQYTIGLVIALGVLLIAFFTFYITNKNDSSKTLEKTEENIKVVSKYKGEDIWEYEVTTELLTPCHDIDIVEKQNALDSEGVTLEIIKKSPDPLKLCAQVTKPFSKTGSYSAPKNANLDLAIVDRTVSKSTTTLKEDGFTLEGRYIGDSSWEYLITGTLPNPCYTAEADALIAESFPEQVTINLNIKAPEGDKICIQQVQELKLTGEYSANEKASLNLRVVRE